MSKRNAASLVLGATVAALMLASAAFAETRIEKSFNLKPGGEFILNSDSGSVTVTGSNEPGAKVLITSNRDDFDRIFATSFEGGPSEVRITVKRREHFGWFHNLNMHFEIQVPMQTQLEIATGGGGINISNLRGAQRLNTSGGGIEVSGVAGDVRADTSGGGIHLTKVDGNAEAHTSGGPIEVRSLEGSLLARTSGGGIRIDGISGRVDAHTSGGSIHADFARGDAQGGELETSGGSIHVALDPSVNLSVDAATSGGSVSSELPLNDVVGKISSSSLHGSLGSGGPLLKLRTSGGSIHITSRAG
jgi:Toastrack DUF4097